MQSWQLGPSIMGICHLDSGECHWFSNKYNVICSLNKLHDEKNHAFYNVNIISKTKACDVHFSESNMFTCQNLDQADVSEKLKWIY